jgi:hypothetical protein
MQIVPVGPGFAAEVRGVTLADVANDDGCMRRYAPPSRSTRCSCSAAKR